MLDAWRESGADRLDPIRFRFIEAMERRTAALGGEARRILDDKLSRLIQAYANDLDTAASRVGDVAQKRDAGGGALAGLIDYIGQSERGDSQSVVTENVLDYFRETWSRLSSERQLKRSLAQVPGNAGPLNSSSLVHRSLSLMRELSPGYLQQFLSYVDALSWMEQMNGGGVPTDKDKDAPRAGKARKGAKGKAR
jgi:hypothetical protein